MIKARPWSHLHLFSHRQLPADSAALPEEQMLPERHLRRKTAAPESDLPAALPADKDSAAGKRAAADKLAADRNSAAGRPAAAARSGQPAPANSSDGRPAPAVCLFSYCAFLPLHAAFLLS